MSEPKEGTLTKPREVLYEWTEEPTYGITQYRLVINALWQLSVQCVSAGCWIYTDFLPQEVEAVKALVKRVEEAEKERDEWRKSYRIERESVDTLDAEITRLREALGEYAECSDGCTCGDGWSHSAAIQALRRESNDD